MCNTSCIIFVGFLIQFILCVNNQFYNLTNYNDKEDIEMIGSNRSALSVNRTAKFFGWWLSIGVGVVRFENSVCAAANGLRGTCYTRRQCNTVGGYASGKCARNIGVCCVVQETCGATSSNNNTYFTNPNFPNTFPGGTTCTLTIQRCNPDICQVRIDFLSLILSQPNGDGVCNNDAMFVTGAASPIGRICGQNTGQHIYLDFNDANNIDLTIFTSSSVALGRQWNLKIAQIGCDSPSRAPSGCLMYYTDESATVRSFNYGQAANSLSPVNNAGALGTRQLANMNYGVCVRMAPSFCSIQWSPASADPFAFTVSGDTPSETVPPLLDPTVGPQCLTDFVVIPNGRYTISGQTMSNQDDRYCGNVFLPVTTPSKPFVLNVVTNGNEDLPDVGNRGFALTYSQQRCGSDLM